jgi:hypothetical protein
VLGGESPLAVMSGPPSEGLARLVAGHAYDLPNALALIVTLVLVHTVWRLSPAWATFVLIGILVPFSAGGLLSMGRITSTLFPTFLAAAAVLPGRALPAVVVAFAVGQGLLAALFYTWRGIY